MTIVFGRLPRQATIASVALLGSSGVANALSRTPSISGNGWVALGIIAALVSTIFLLIMGALHLERRDAGLGRRSRHDDGWFGGFHHSDDDDGHHHGGEGSN